MSNALIVLPNGDSEYALNSFGEPVYPLVFDRNHLDDIFAKKDGQYFYVQWEDWGEQYPMEKDRHIVFRRNGVPVYAKRSDGSEFYPIHLIEIGVEEFAETDLNTSTYVYAKDRLGQFFYPRNAVGDQYLCNDQYIYIDEHHVQYPLQENGEPIYERNAAGDEVYHEKDQVFTIAKDVYGNEVYAKKQNGDEYYPNSFTFATTKEGYLNYARTKEGNVIFPYTDQENYIRDQGVDLDVFVGGGEIDRYAKDKNLKEYYPNYEVDDNQCTEFILKNTYARAPEPFYPLDEFGNEYLVDYPALGMAIEKYMPVGYPITNDDFIIVPNHDDMPRFANTDVSFENIVAQLYRDKDIKFRDFLTNVKHPSRTSRSEKRGHYVSKPVVVDRVPSKEDPTTPSESPPEDSLDPISKYPASNNSIPSGVSRPTLSKVTPVILHGADQNNILVMALLILLAMIVATYVSYAEI